VDCLTLWLTNLLMLDDEQRLAQERDALLACLSNCPARSSWSATKPAWAWCPWAN
jgi:adenosyl cobinamide kinase/adenosyl cobinamide phosphate guanylyltransferase